MKTDPFAWPLVACLTCASLAAAQGGKQEIKELKKHSKEVLAQYKADLAQGADELEAQIHVFELNFDDLQFDDGPLEDLVTALSDFQLDAALAEANDAFDMELWVGQALEQLPAGGPDEDVAPVGLNCGDSGVMDDHAAAARKVTAKVYAGLNKKLAKLAVKLRKQTDMRLKFVLQPVEPHVFAPQDSGGTSSFAHSLDIDLVVGFNRGGVDNDGRGWVGGTGPAGVDDVTVSFNGANSASATATPQAIGFLASRWLTSTDAQAEPLDEGNYLVFAQQGLAATGEAIGLR
jgi:hypothetical protein